MASPFVFPLEIFDHIIDEVASDTENNLASDFQDLRACALTCKDFLQPSRQYLFRKVNLSKDTQCSSFHDALTSCPDIAHYVHVLYLNNISENTRVQSILHNPALPSILASFENVEALLITWRGDLIWRDVSREVEEKIATLILSPTLMELSLDHVVGIPSTYLKWIAHIPTVRFSWVHFSGLREAEPLVLKDPVARPHDCYLRTLNLGLAYESDRYLSQLVADGLSPPTCKLETLTIQNDSDFGAGIRVINKHRNTLTTIVFYDSLPEEDFHERQFDLLPHLRKIRFEADFCFTDDDPFNKIKQFLASSITTRNSLEEITISVDCHYRYSPNWAKMADWDALDIFLSGRQFKNLRKLQLTGLPVPHLKSNTPSENKHQYEIVKKQVCDLLGRIHERGLLEFKYALVIL
ncbi:hypothetical protein BDQ17DRAFT_1371744 [Cyathus striatus]|nr:hypothetical protein BDQ17DRAFT_1371744 [Cyathus striatus]